MDIGKHLKWIVIASIVLAFIFTLGDVLKEANKPPPKPRPQQKQERKIDRTPRDWEWLKQGATMYHDDGTPIEGGPVIYKRKKIRTRTVPTGGRSQMDTTAQEIEDRAYQRFEQGDW